MFRRREQGLDVLLVHPGGPFWSRRDDGAWSIPKGAVERGEDWLATAVREFREETGLEAEGPFLPLAPIKQRSGKTVHAWAFEGDCDPATVASNTFLLEWPPRSGTMKEFPEVDRAAWFTVEEAKQKLVPGQVPLVEELQQAVGQSPTR
jgi:predicted NUDIX family NTP pyrophosphohydrolase